MIQNDMGDRWGGYMIYQKDVSTSYTQQPKTQNNKRFQDIDDFLYIPTYYLHLRGIRWQKKYTKDVLMVTIK